MLPFVLSPPTVMMIAAMTRSTATAVTATCTPEMLVTRATTDFSIKLFQKLKNANDGGSVFFSPYSISNALAITAEGARGETAEEMGNVLSLPVEEQSPDDPDRPWKLENYLGGVGILNEQFNRKDKPYTLDIANAIWTEKSLQFKTEYANTLATLYGEETFQVANFQHHPDKERVRINTWVEDATGSNIKDLIAEGNVDKSTAMVLVNAIYFKANWLTQFDKARTEDGDFFLDGNYKKTVKMMNAREMAGIKYGAFNSDGSFFETPEMVNMFDETDTAYYPTEDGFSIIELPYKGNELSMVVLVPNKKVDGLSSIEELIYSEDNLSSLTEALKERKVHVALPKFKAEAEYVLNDYLRDMGMKSAFSPSANFGGMIEANGDSSTSGIQISLVVHKAFIEVDEEGSEAAAATAVMMSRSVVQPFVPEFRADRPFIYLIRDTKSGTVLFLGRMADPNST